MKSYRLEYTEIDSLKALLALHELTRVRPWLKLTQFSCSRAYTSACQSCNVNEIWVEHM